MSAVVMTNDYHLPPNHSEYSAPMSRSQSDGGDYRTGFGRDENNTALDRYQYRWEAPCQHPSCTPTDQYRSQRRQNYAIIPASASASRPSYSDSDSHQLSASYQTSRPDDERSPSPRIRLGPRAPPASRSPYADLGFHRLSASYQTLRPNGTRSPSPQAHQDRRASLPWELGVSGFADVDAEAAADVEKNISSYNHEDERRRLLEYICSDRQTRHEDLMEILQLADLVLFDGRLHGRVTWRWSNDDALFEHQYLGAAATKITNGFIEIQIILSKPLLGDHRYDPRLLLSTWMHELIHAYCFIYCGELAIQHGGHTTGFKRIGEAIDDWSEGRLYLRDTKADLNKFARLSPMRPRRSQRSTPDPSHSMVEISGRQHRIQKRQSRSTRPSREYLQFSDELFTPHGSAFTRSQSSQPLPQFSPHTFLTQPPSQFHRLNMVRS